MDCLAKEFSLTHTDNSIDDSDLFVQRHQKVFSLDWADISECYDVGCCAIYLIICIGIGEGKHHKLPFLILKEGIAVGGMGGKGRGRRECLTDLRRFGDEQPYVEREIFYRSGNLDQAFPMFVGISNLVNGPKGVIPSGVWFLGLDESPLLWGEFLFYFAGQNSGVWEWVRLPTVIDAPKWEPYARDASPVVDDEVDGHFVESASEVADGFNCFPSDLNWNLLVDCCNHVRNISVTLNSGRNGLQVDVPIDGRFEVIKLASSSFDLFV